MQVPTPERFGAYEVSIVKWAGREDDVSAGLWTLFMVGLYVLFPSLSGWGRGAAARARWLIRVQGEDAADAKVVDAAYTLRGARRRRRKVAAILASGDQDAMGLLPNVDYT